MASSPRDPTRPGAILAGALRCFERVGVEAATIDDLRAASGASVGSIYHHFGHKQGVVNALLVAGLQDHLEALRGPFSAATDAREGVEAVVTGLLGWVAGNEAWARFIYLRTAVPAADVAPLVEAVGAEWSALVGVAWKGWVAAGEVAPLPAALVAPLLLGPAHDLARRWLAGAVGGDLIELAPGLAEATWRGLGGTLRR